MLSRFTLHNTDIKTVTKPLNNELNPMTITFLEAEFAVYMLKNRQRGSYNTIHHGSLETEDK